MPLFSNALVQILTDRVSKVESDSSTLFSTLPVYPATPAVPTSSTDTVPVFYSIITATNDPDLEIGGNEAAFSADQALQSTTLLNTSLATLPTWVNTVVTTVPDQTQNPAIPWTSLSQFLVNRGFRVHANWATLFNVTIKGSAQQLTPVTVFPGVLALGTYTASSSTFVTGTSVNTSLTGRVRFSVYDTVVVGANPLAMSIVVQDGATTSNLTEVVTIPIGTAAGTGYFIGAEQDIQNISTTPIAQGVSQIVFTNTVAPSGSNNYTGTASNFRANQYIMIEGFDSFGIYQQEWNQVSSVSSTPPPVFGNPVTITLSNSTRHVYATQVTVVRLFQNIINVTTTTQNSTDVAIFNSVDDRKVGVTTLNTVSAPVSATPGGTTATPIIVSTGNVFGKLLMGVPVEFEVPNTYTISSGALPLTTINVVSTAAFNLGSGSIKVSSTSGLQTVTYTGTTATSFIGCSGGAGNLSTGSYVYPTGAGVGASSVSNTTTNYVAYTNEFGQVQAYATLSAFPAASGSFVYTSTVNNLVTNSYTITT